ncbi:MAG TPA: hypothetical protein VGL70_13425 [Candidatus Binatia bacterium]|jgi:hypothetical protein
MKAESWKINKAISRQRSAFSGSIGHRYCDPRRPWQEIHIEE